MKNTALYLSPELIKRQLQSLLNQEELKRSPILTRFLEHVVLTKLSGREEEIKEYTIATQALGRSPVFNPQLDAIVRIHASRLRNILLHYYHGEGKDSPVMICIPKGTYVPHFEVNNGNLQYHVVQPTEIIPSQVEDLIPNEAHKNPKLAVLSFHDLSPQQSNDGFLTSLGEQLTASLAKFENLSVISFYATQKMDAVVDHLKDLKNQGIDYILTGSIRLFNGTMKINIQLITVDRGNIIWSDSYLRHQITDENAFDIQEEIISQVANAIADDPKMISTLNKEKQWENIRGGGPILDAIDQYFNYIYDYNSAKFGATLRAAENAYQMAGDNVLTVAILSKLYLDQYACAADNNKDILQKGIELARKAVSLDPRSQLAQKALAWGLILTGDKLKAQEAAGFCIDINPAAASSLGTLGLGFIMMGELEKGCGMLKKALGLNTNPSACSKLGFSLYYYHNKNYEESGRWLDRLPPFDIPFSRLLKIAVDGNLKGKVVNADDSVSKMRGHEKDIVNRIALNAALKNGIFDGWRLAGFVA